MDRRLVVDTYADLVNTDTWLSNDGKVYVYKGMLVSVTNDGQRNGVYRLENEDYTDLNSWIQVDAKILSTTSVFNEIITLKSVDWTDDLLQVIVYPQINLSSAIWVSPVLSNKDIYSSYGILAIEQGVGTITFSAITLPTTDLLVNVTVMNGEQNTKNFELLINSGDDSNITIPTFGTNNYNWKISWGDGTSDIYNKLNTTDITHMYPLPNTEYIINIEPIDNTEYGCLS